MQEPPLSLATAQETDCLTATLESISDAVLMLDRSWNIRYMNGNAERLLKVQRHEVVGKNVWTVFPEAVDGPYYRAYHMAVETNSLVEFEEHYAPLDLWTEIRAYPSQQGVTIYFRDISERKAIEAQIHNMAFYDKLTGLPNRQLLLDRAGHALSLGHLGAMLFIDLDNFKTINDTRGHDKGDMLLQLVAARLRAEVRECDTVARFGGDEFIVLLEDLGSTENDVARVAQDIALKIVRAFAEPFDIEGMEQYSTPSIGITVFSGACGSVDEVLKRADLAMYQAKAAGRNTVSFFDPTMQARVSARAALEADMRRALGNDEFVLHYQPLMSVDGTMAGVEALVRWKHPQRGLVPPAEFIPVAEESNLILPLGRWVMREAGSRLAQWSGDTRTAGLEIAVNVSAAQFHRPDFVEHVLEVLAQTGARADRLRLELTESLLLKDVEGTVGKMQQLRAAGVSFALDDFGTGYSSLSYLHRLPLDQLKIDRSFIWSAVKEDSGAAIVRIIVLLGKALNMSVLAEGVETQEQLNFVIAEGCQYYQGYIFSKPLPEPELLTIIAGL
ncbi:putative bifunctional diguanylate cyclase/phosphodiesterase [Duganella violaceipulchra]|uniref:Diguanylate cyclase (GGDEF)-like protein/PAS domain S-box-containing protein n=1 Tax=Duganella violaceipulchra TaxID=2849652 RepID=A0AA41L082_9BURK|nr:EAL domain-containing protein [Duganella violaceicalia]MBV6322196.1 EAL domain-containing protein [Duganella violaceicalia]MCP2011343.1 diguanylate cyclase (GGDEF)-like protein/PAS domain S-box-containing protein [Duganella violaceicalia]